MSSSSATQSASSAVTSLGPTMAITIPRPDLRITLNSGPAATEFHLFAYFPSELREKVWKMAVDADEKIIEMKHPSFHNCHDKVIYQENINDHRNLLGACVEARNIMINECTPLQLCTKRTVYVNVSTDTVYFGPSSYLPDWELLDFFDRFNWNRAMTMFIQVGLSGRLRHGAVRGLHPLLTSIDTSEKAGLKLIKKLAFDDSFLFRAKRNHIWKATLDRFPACSSLTIITGDMGEKQLRKDDYKKHTATIPFPQLVPFPQQFLIAHQDAYRSLRDEINHQLLPYVPDPTDNNKTYNLDITPNNKHPISHLGEVTFDYCPSHVQATVEHLVTFFSDRNRLMALGGLVLPAEAADKGWSVMIAKRGGEYHGSADRMDDGFFDKGNFVEFDLDLGIGLDGEAGITYDEGLGSELVLEDPNEEDMEFEDEDEVDMEVEEEE